MTRLLKLTAVLPAALLLAGSLTAALTAARAGTGVYDMSALLNEAHPFATPPPVAQPSVAQAPVAQAPAPMPAPMATPAPAPVQSAPPRAAPAPAIAPRTPVHSGNTSFITLAGGYYDINDNEDAGEFRIEWKGRKWFWAVKPIVGLMATTEAAIYGYAGIGWDLYFGRRIVVNPSFAVGAYSDGNGKDLGSVVEFRSALELAWRFDNESRLGVMFYHLSNAGIDDNNPGTEVLSVGYSIPLN